MEYLFFLFIFYLPVITRLVFFFIHDDFFLIRRLNRLAGRYELFLGWIRDYTLIPLSLFWFGERMFDWYQSNILPDTPYELGFLALSLYARRWRWRGLAVLQELARFSPRIHPTEFFEHLYGRLGMFPHRIPERPKRLIDPNHLDFRSGKKSKKSFFILLRGTYDTFLFATLACKAFRWRGAKYIRTVGSGISIVWASRMAQLAKIEVRVERNLRLAEISGGKWIYALNHTSLVDFCLAPYAYLRENKDGSAKSFMPLVMVAKDHFKDNFFLYRVIGLGKILEALGMIFVDRKSKKPGKEKEAVSTAVKKIIASQMSLSIYPQGTRSWGQKDRYGERWDAAYFCVGGEARLKKEGGYFKKGMAYIAVETALSLLKHGLHGKVWIIPVGLLGAGTTCPKNSLKVQTETSVHIRMGDPLCIDSNEMVPFKSLSFQEASDNLDYQKKVAACAADVDASLQQLLGVKTRLERRFFTDLRAIFEGQAIDEVAVSLKEWREGDPLVYVILDSIYALPQKRWYGFLVELAQSLRDHHPKEKLIQLRDKIAGYF